MRWLGLFALDVLVCLSRLLVPAVWVLITMSVVALQGRIAAAQSGPAFGGLMVGGLSACVVVVLLLWATRSRWWIR